MTGLTNLGIDSQVGQGAFLPNQPILHNCIVKSTVTTTVKPGTVVKLSSATVKNQITVEPAGTTDLPFGVVSYCSIKTGASAGARVSVLPLGSFVYMQAAGATNCGAFVKVDSNGKMVATSTADDKVLGIAMTQALATNDIIVVQVTPQVI